AELELDATPSATGNAHERRPTPSGDASSRSVSASSKRGPDSDVVDGAANIGSAVAASVSELVVASNSWYSYGAGDVNDDDGVDTSAGEAAADARESIEQNEVK